MPSQLPAPLTEGMTPKMLAFLDAYVRFGGRYQERAAIVAGYAPSGAGAVASRLLRRPDVLRVLRHITETVIKGDVLRSADVLREIRDDPGAETGERRKAASELLDRAGMLIAKLSQHHVVVDDRRHNPAADAASLTLLHRQLIEDAARAGAVQVDEVKLASFLRERQEANERGLERLRANAVDAEYEVIEDEGPDDLSDVLGPAQS